MAFIPRIKARKHVQQTVALDPAVLGKDGAIELLAEVLNHVVTLELAVDKKVVVKTFSATGASSTYAEARGR